MLTAWSAAGVAGPLLISKIKDSTGEYDTALYIIAGMLVVSCVIPLIVRPPAAMEDESGRAHDEARPGTKGDAGPAATGARSA